MSRFDVRMRGFRDRSEVDALLSLLDSIAAPLSPELIELPAAAGRVLATDVVATVDVPPFHRAAMDGYALISHETFGAGPYNPLEFAVVGVALPGAPYSGTVQSGQAVRIMTGAPIPAGADAVLQAEAAEEADGRLHVTESVTPARHVGHRGEDIAAGTTVVCAGRVLRPQDVAVLASIGASPLSVIRRPTVALLVSGDELLPCGSKPEGFRIVDSNSVMLDALVRRDGALPAPVLMLPDNRESIRTAVREARADVLLCAGGSSVGQEDHLPSIVAELGELRIHGVALRPASPTGLGFIDGRFVFLLPGNPVSCLCAYDLFAGRALRRLGGRPAELPYQRHRLPLRRKIVSAVGRVDYVRVQVRDRQVEPLATTGASVLSTTTRADGFVLVPRDREGYAPGDEIEVYLFDARNL